MPSLFSRRATLAAVLLLAGFATAQAAAGDYKFSLVSAKSVGPGKTDVTVRLVHVPDNKPVTDAVVFQTKVDMAPGGMADMTGKVTRLPADATGPYRFRTDVDMPGGCGLTLSAKVQGEADTIRGTVIFNTEQ